MDKYEIARRLRDIQNGLVATVSAMSETDLVRHSGYEWPAADYLKHLILSVKPLARALQLPRDRLVEMFGRPQRPSISFDELREKYKIRLAEGLRAEDVANINPVDYRYPEGMTSVKDALITAWNEGNDRMLDALDNLDETELDAYQLPHPAVGMLTLREMLYFTIEHNELHWNDIARLAQQA